jgi:glutamine synthetase
MEKSSLVKKVLGPHTFETFLENKRREWDKYRTYVTDFEIKEYLPIL